MESLKTHVRDVPDFPQAGILFRDIAPLLRDRFEDALLALEALFTDAEWSRVEAIAGIESRGFILGAALASRRRKGFVPIRKKGKLPPPVVDVPYALEYGTGFLEMQPGSGTVLVIDDVLATGGTLSAGADLCARAGFSVAGLGVLIDIGIAPGFRWNGLEARTVLRYG